MRPASKFLAEKWTTMGCSGQDTIGRGKSGASPWTAGLDVDKFGGSAPRLVAAADCSVWSPAFEDLTSERMAEANSLNTTAAPQARYVLRYTAALPDNIPPSISRAVSDRSLRAFSTGVCYARSATYPNGVYWVMLTFY